MPRLFRRARWAADERGVTIIEVLAALTVMAIVAVGLTTSMRANLNLVGKANGRQVATQMAMTAIEDSRNLGFDKLAIVTGETFNTTDPTSPDALVTGTSPNYYYNGEPIVFGSDGSDHDVTSLVGQAPYRVYRYVTWVTSGGSTQAYKRVTVVAQWPGKNANGNVNSLTTSTIVSDTAQNGWTQAVSTTTSTTVVGATTTTTAATTTTTTSSCPTSDTTGPTASASNGTGSYSNSSTLSLLLSASDTCTPITMQFSNDSGTTWSTAETFATAKSWTVTSGDGSRTVSVRFKDGKGNATTLSVTVTIDTVAPTAPTMQSTVTVQGNSKVTVKWSPSTDTNLSGYRIYRQQGSNAASRVGDVTASVCSGSVCSFQDTSAARKTTYTYYVVAYDKATNTSAQSNSVNATTT